MVTHRFGSTVTQARHGRGGGAGDHADGVTRIVNPPGRVTRQLGDVLGYSCPNPVQQDADLGSGRVKQLGHWYGDRHGNSLPQIPASNCYYR